MSGLRCHCNRCGRYCNDQDAKDNKKLESNYFHKFATMFSYDSPFDMSDTRFTLCEICLLDIMKEFKHVPKIVDMLSGNKNGNLETIKIPYGDEDFFSKHYKKIENLPIK